MGEGAVEIKSGGRPRAAARQKQVGKGGFRKRTLIAGGGYWAVLRWSPRICFRVSMVSGRS